MASTLQEIKTQIVAAKNANVTLAGLNSPSLTAIWLLWIDIIAETLLVQQQLQDAFVAEVEAKIALATWGTTVWFVGIAKKFQYGDAVEQLPDNQPYSIIDVGKQIVTLASMTESGNILNMKVAKGTPASPTALSPAEIVAFTIYINKMKGAGTLVNVISLPADQLRLTATIEYDGQYLLSDIQTRVQTAVENFLFAIPFDGKFYKNKLIDAIDDEVGVVNFNQDTAIMRAIQGATDTLLNSAYQTIAGYLRLDLAYYNLTYIAV